MTTTPFEKAKARYESARRAYWFCCTNYIDDVRDEYLAAKDAFAALGGEV